MTKLCQRTRLDCDSGSSIQPNKPHTFESLSYANFLNLVGCASCLIPYGEKSSTFTHISPCSTKVMIERKELGNIRERMALPHLLSFLRKLMAFCDSPEQICEAFHPPKSLYHYHWHLILALGPHDSDTAILFFGWNYKICCPVMVAFLPLPAQRRHRKNQSIIASCKQPVPILLQLSRLWTVINK